MQTDDTIKKGKKRKERSKWYVETGVWGYPECVKVSPACTISKIGTKLFC